MVAELGPRAAAWAGWLRATYPDAPARGIARLAAHEAGRHGWALGLGSAGGRVAATLCLPAAAWVRATVVLRVAAAYGHDPTDPRRAGELLTLLDAAPAEPGAGRAEPGTGPAGSGTGRAEPGTEPAEPGAEPAAVLPGPAQPGSGSGPLASGLLRSGLRASRLLGSGLLGPGALRSGLIRSGMARLGLRGTLAATAVRALAAAGDHRDSIAQLAHRATRFYAPR